MKHKLLSLLAALMLWLGANEAHAFCFSGTAKYRNAWQSTAWPGNRINAMIGQDLGITYIKIRFTNNSTGAIFDGLTTNSNGNYQVCGMPSGNYTPSLVYDDQANFFKLVSSFGGSPMVSSSAVALPLTVNTTYNFTVGVTSGWTGATMNRNTQTFTVAREHFRFWASALSDYVPEFFTAAKVEIKHVTSTASAGFNVNVDFNFPNALWHELGHRMQWQMQQTSSGTKWNNQAGFSQVWNAPACDYVIPAGTLTQSPGSYNMSEGWADFVEYVTIVDQPNWQGSGKVDCSNDNVASAFINPSTIPACGSGSTWRQRAQNRDVFIDLVDSHNARPATCYSESVQLPLGAVAATVFYNPFNESDVYGFSTRSEDNMGIMEVLAHFQDAFPTMPTYKLWANSRFQPGKSHVVLQP